MRGFRWPPRAVSNTGKTGRWLWKRSPRLVGQQLADGLVRSRLCDDGVRLPGGGRSPGVQPASRKRGGLLWILRARSWSGKQEDSCFFRFSLMWIDLVPPPVPPLFPWETSLKIVVITSVSRSVSQQFPTALLSRCLHSSSKSAARGGSGEAEFCCPACPRLGGEMTPDCLFVVDPQRQMHPAMAIFTFATLRMGSTRKAPTEAVLHTGTSSPLLRKPAVRAPYINIFP